MRTILCSIGLTGVLTLTGACGGMDHSAHQKDHAEHSNSDAHGGHVHDAAKGATAEAELTATPTNPAANAPVDLAFTIKNPDGSTVKTLDLVHEKPLHLIVVSSDLDEFYHLHPEPQTDGTLHVTHTFPNGDDYRFFIDFKPQGGEPAVSRQTLTVSGPRRAEVALVADTAAEKTVDGLRVTMKPQGALKAGNDVMIDFSVADAATGKPATDLEKYLGEYAHFVVISQDASEYLHVHPMSGGAHDMGGMHDTKGQHDHNTAPQAGGSPSSIGAHTNFPKAGLYKIWAQFQRGGRVVTVPFVVTVQ